MPCMSLVSIKLTKNISVLRVSLPRELYMTCPVGTLSALKACLESQPLPPQWFLSSSGAYLGVFKVQHQESAVEISFSVSIDEHLQWSITIGDRTLSPVNSGHLLRFHPSLVAFPMCCSFSQFWIHAHHARSEQKFMDDARSINQSIQQGIGMIHLYTVHLL